jgi:hypothetical protein
MAVTLINKHSETAGDVPATTELLVGEIAVNTADKTWFTKTTSGGIVCLNYLTLIDGGEITDFVELITSTGQNLVDASGNIIGFR